MAHATRLRQHPNAPLTREGWRVSGWVRRSATPAANGGRPMTRWRTTMRPGQRRPEVSALDGGRIDREPRAELASPNR